MFTWIGAKLYTWLAISKERYDDRPVRLTSSKGLRKSTKYSSVSIEDDDSDEPGLNMRVMKVHGGRLIRFSSYDDRTDRHNTRTYIIVDEADFEKELGKIITLESMRM